MTADMFGLAGKVAMIVGGGQGMGEASATFLARAGCASAIIDIVEERARAVAAKVKSIGPASIAIGANMLDHGQIAPTLERVETELGGPDILVMIVGQALFKPAVDFTEQDWDMEMQRNLRYAFFVAQAFARSAIRRNRPAVIVSIASVSGLQSAPQHVAYGAAKLGLVNLVRSLACEWAPHSIRINAIAPGVIATPRLPDTPESAQTIQKSMIPFRRRGHVDDIGKSVLFLSSDMSGYITGVTLPVDGGWMAANLLFRG